MLFRPNILCSPSDDLSRTISMPLFLLSDLLSKTFSSFFVTKGFSSCSWTEPLNGFRASSSSSSKGLYGSRVTLHFEVTLISSWECSPNGFKESSAWVNGFRESSLFMLILPTFFGLYVSNTTPGKKKENNIKFGLDSEHIASHMAETLFLNFIITIIIIIFSYFLIP